MTTQRTVKHSDLGSLPDIISPRENALRYSESSPVATPAAADPLLETPELAALIFSDPQTSALTIAALRVLDRLVVAIHRAGVRSITIVTQAPLPRLERTGALGIPVRVTSKPPADSGPALVLGTNLLVQPADIRALVRHGARLTTADGAPLAIGVLPRIKPDWQAALDARPPLAARGVAVQVSDTDEARAAERMLWASLTSSADGLVDKHFNRPCGRYLSRILIHTPVSPNAVSVASILIGLAAAGCFAVGSFSTAVVAALLFQLSAIVDCVDGDIARVLFKESPLGKWLDLAGDQVVHLAVFAGITAGLIRGGQSEVALWLGISAVLGALFSFMVVVRGMRQPEQLRGRLTQKLIDSLTNRDFSVLVLALACCNWLECFLWLSAIGSHLFWLTALGLQLGGAAAKQRPAQ